MQRIIRDVLIYYGTHEGFAVVPKPGEMEYVSTSATRLLIEKRNKHQIKPTTK